MGVVYKLKKEIVDFIINEKKINPSLGCRNLVGLIEAKFQTKISKSAINGVIKGAQLSSSIGRKPIAVKISSLRHSERSPKGEVKNPIEESHREEILPPLLRKQRGQNDVSGVLCDGAGCFFLKAAQWELFRRPMLGKMIRKYVSSGLTGDVDTLLDVLLFLPMFGIYRVEDVSAYQGSGLWAMHGLTESIKPDKFLSLMNGIQNNKDFSLRLSQEIPQIFFEAAYIKIILEDGTELALDAQCRNFQPIKETPVYYSSPLEKSLERLTGQMIANRCPLSIKNISTQVLGGQDDNGFSPSVYQLIAAFENMPGKKMVKAAILDEHQEEISKFTTIPLKKRFFIIGAGICHSEERSDEAMPTGRQESHPEEILRFAQNDEKASEFYEESFLVKKNSILTEDLGLRAIFVKKPDSKDQALVILTNVPVSVQSPREVISEYLKEWPGFLRHSEEHSDEESQEILRFAQNDGKTKVAFNNFEIPDLWKNLEAILAGLNKYCQRHFFPKDYARMDISVLKERFYQLAGYFKNGSSGLEVSLILPEGYAYRQDLEQAVRKINEFPVKNYTGQTLFLKIAP